MKKEIIFVLFVFLFVLPLVSAQVVINEIMPHSNNNWNDEWIELYNPSDSMIELNEWQIGDKLGNDTFSLMIYPNSFALIVDTTAGCLNFNISNLSCVELTTIGKGLNDDNETVFLYDINSTLIDSFSWNEDLKNSGKSWSRDETNSWTICEPTPGQQNDCPQGQEPECEADSDCNEDEICQEGICVPETGGNEEEESILEITDAPEDAVFGEVIDIKINIYRGDIAKYAVYLRVEDKDGGEVSEENVLHILTKYVDYKMKIPVQLKLNCDENFEAGNYFIILEGLGERTEQEISLEGKSSLCPEKIEEIEEAEEEQKADKKETEENKITGKAVGSESGNKEDKNEDEISIFLKITPYLLSLICLLIVIYILKNKKI